MKTPLQGKYSVTIASVTMEARIAFNRKSGYRKERQRERLREGGSGVEEGELNISIV